MNITAASLTWARRAGVVMVAAGTPKNGANTLCFTPKSWSGVYQTMWLALSAFSSRRMSR